MRSIPRIMLVLSLSGLIGCALRPKDTPLASERISVGWGPEDLVLDDFGAAPRLLISCDDRREVPARFSGIVSYDIATGKVDTLIRREEPNNMRFHPLGIDVARMDGKVYLYAISIDDVGGSHSVIKYEVVGKELYWIRSYHSELFRSPNGVSIHSNGGFYVSNDSYKRHSFGELALGKKKSQLVYCSIAGEARVVQDKIAYGNGVVQSHGFLFQSALRGNRVFRYRVAEDGSLSDQQEWAKVKGPDNLRLDGDDLLVACHTRPFAFLRYQKSAEKLSPTAVYRISTGSGDQLAAPEIVYYNRGTSISGNGTGLIFQDKLYISQVLDPFILKVDLNSGN